MSPENNDNQQQELDVLAKKTVQSLYERIENETPDPGAAWKTMQAKLQHKRKRHSWLKVSTIAASIAFITFIVGTLSTGLSPAYALQQMIQVVKDAQAGLVHIMYGGDTTSTDHTNGAKTPPPPDLIEGDAPSEAPSPETPVISDPIEIGLNEAIRQADFPIYTPAYVPNHVDLEKVELYPDIDGVYQMVRIEYLSPEGSLISLTQRKLNTEGTPWNTSVEEHAGKVSSIQVHQREAILVEYEEGGGRIEWLDPSNTYLLQLTGKLSSEELIQMAESTSEATLTSSN